MLPNRMTGSWITLPTDALRIYFNLCIIKYFLNIISPNNDMKAKVDALLSAYPSIDITAMGFPRGFVIGKKAPDVCPVCDHPQAYFQVKAENY